MALKVCVSRIMSAIIVPSDVDPPARGLRTLPAALILIDFENKAEVELLQNQRIQCGWKANVIDEWCEQARRGERAMFWIGLAASTAIDHGPSADRVAEDVNIADAPAIINRLPVYSSSGSDNLKDNRYLSVGHISLDRVDHDHQPPDLTLADPNLPHPLLTITTLFVLPAFAGSGLANSALKACEQLAQESPFGSEACRAVTLNTLVRSPGTLRWIGAEQTNIEDWVDEGGKNLWEMLGAKKPRKKFDKGAWYQRLGYVPFKEIEIQADAKFVYYRKELCGSTRASATVLVVDEVQPFAEDQEREEIVMP